MERWRRVGVWVWWLALIIVLPTVVGDRLAESFGIHWWTNAVKMGPFIIGVQIHLRNMRMEAGRDA